MEKKLINKISKSQERPASVDASQKMKIFKLFGEYIKELKGRLAEERDNESFVSGEQSLIFKLEKAIERLKSLRYFVLAKDKDIAELSFQELNDLKLKVEKTRTEIRESINKTHVGNESKAANYKILIETLTKLRKKLLEQVDLKDIADLYTKKEDIEAAIKENEIDLMKLKEQFKEISHLDPEYERQRKEETREYIDDFKRFNESLKKQIKNFK